MWKTEEGEYVEKRIYCPLSSGEIVPMSMQHDVVVAIPPFTSLS